MGNKILEDLYQVKDFNSRKLESFELIGKITERDKFRAAKQILLGLAILYVLTIFVYIYKPEDGKKLLDITTITFPPLATLILTAYFRDKSH